MRDADSPRGARTGPGVHVAADYEAMCDAAARHFVDAARRAVAQRGRFAVALSGGSTPVGLYRRLAAAPLTGAVDWGRCRLFWGDERWVPPDHPDSNYGMVRRILLDRVPVPAANVYPMPTGLDDPGAAARAYERTLAEALEGEGEGTQRPGREGATPRGRVGARHAPRPPERRRDAPPRLDLVLLGVGEDGHTASLFPGTAALEERHRWVVATRRPGTGEVRLTMAPPLLEAAREVLFLVAGGAKAHAVARAFADCEPPSPAAGVRPTGDRVFWYLDRLAAADVLHLPHDAVVDF